MSKLIIILYFVIGWFVLRGLDLSRLIVAVILIAGFLLLRYKYDKRTQR